MKELLFIYLSNEADALIAIFFYLDPVYTVPDPYGRDIKLKSLKTSIAFKFMLMLHNLIPANHGKRSRNEYDRKLTEFDVVIMGIGTVQAWS